MKRPTLTISYDGPGDWMTAIEFGRVADGVPPDRWRVLGPNVAWLLDEPGGHSVGVRVQEVSQTELHWEDDEQLDFQWVELNDDEDGPFFDAPTLGLAEVPAALIVLAAFVERQGRSTLNRSYFHAATLASGSEAHTLWEHCLATGDLTAHYGLGVSRCKLGDFEGAYDQLR